MVKSVDGEEPNMVARRICHVTLVGWSCDSHMMVHVTHLDVWVGFADVARRGQEK